MRQRHGHRQHREQSKLSGLGCSASGFPDSARTGDEDIRRILIDFDDAPSLFSQRLCQLHSTLPLFPQNSPRLSIPRCLAASLPRCLTASLPHCLAASLPRLLSSIHLTVTSHGLISRTVWRLPFFGELGKYTPAIPCCAPLILTFMHCFFLLTATSTTSPQVSFFPHGHASVEQHGRFQEG